MSTYNGERYLIEQIDSILAQERVDVHLLVRDDGSKDRTCEILDKYVLSHPNIEVVKAENVGFIKSFSKLIEMAQNTRIQADYFAFSDQDDVWMPHKLKMASDSLSHMDQEKPLLFSSNSMYVDETLNPIGLFHKEELYRTKENVMIYPTEQGCSMVFNRKAVELYNHHHPTVSWHDRWMCLICNFMGEMVYCNESLFYYRIHSSNTLSGKRSFLKVYSDDIKEFFTTPSVNYPMIIEFYNSFQNYLDDNAIHMIDDYIAYRHSFRIKMKIIFLSKYQYSFLWWRRLRNAFLVLFNKR